MTYNWRPRGINAEQFNDEDSHWIIEPFGNKGHFIAKLAAEYDTMTGAAVSENFKIDQPHRLCTVEAKHTDSTGANSTIALTAAQFKVDKKWKTLAGNSSWFVLWDFSGIAGDSDYIQPFGEPYERPPSKYEITVNTTENHLMYYEVIFQLLDKRGREVPTP